MLLHGIMSTIAEFYSRNLATEVIKGMTQKVASGGTPSRAPVGYLNTRSRDDLGREIRTVEIDPVRGPLVQWAFQAYASGNWTLSQLHDELTDRGLTTLPTPKRPAKPISQSSIHRMLGNPYYKGDVIWRGTRYEGKHPRLVEPEVWYQVQNILTAHNTAGDRTQAHDHYLKSTVYCGQCGSRLVITNAKNAQGAIYPYFVCAGRARKRTDCTRSAILVTTVERLILDFYQRIEIPADLREDLHGMLTQDFDDLLARTEAELEELASRKRELEEQQAKLLRAHLAEAVPLDLLKREQDRLQVELTAVNSRLEDHHSDYADARAHLEDSLGLLGEVSTVYTRGDDQVRRLCNQAFFTKLYIDEDGEVQADIARPYNMLLDPAVHTQARQWGNDPDSYVGPAQTSDAKNSRATSSNLTHWVGLMEPCGNRRRRIEKLVFAWNQAILGGIEPACEQGEPLIRDSTEATRRPRTPLTEAEVDAMRTARANGVSVPAREALRDSSRGGVGEDSPAVTAAAARHAASVAGSVVVTRT
ncbi:hypothetical protein GCM10027079_22980 [Sediminivirga luteola]|uniref:Recombinase domain-containing protein n=2 Tax=Sediminivirga luteola TaxID=1774748 RepID=A0A8J2XM60_9MICO|nr:hypothetical protein GCM10011333_34630 [Sediminivirga luteola]